MSFGRCGGVEGFELGAGDDGLVLVAERFVVLDGGAQDPHPLAGFVVAHTGGEPLDQLVAVGAEHQEGLGAVVAVDDAGDGRSRWRRGR